MRAVLLLQCPDRPGIVATVGAFVAEAGGNIIEADQHSDPAAGLFLQRVEFDVDTTRAELAETFAPIAERYAMQWDVHDLGTRPRVALLVSRQGHCLGDLLVRFELGEIPGQAVVVASNHDTNADLVARFGVPFARGPSARRRPRRAGTRTRARSWSDINRTWSCSPATCSCSPTGSSSRGGNG